MPQVTRISPLNNIRFVQQNLSLPAKYNTQQFDKAWLSEQLRPWEYQAKYFMKQQTSDAIDLQIWSSSVAPMLLQIAKCDGTIVFSEYMTFPGGIPQIFEQGEELFVQRIKNKTALAALPEGIYYYLLTVEFTSTSHLFISEPVSLREKHPNTVLIEYGNSYNKDSVVFEQTNQRFSLRVDAFLTDLQPKVDRVVFMDQGENAVPISATAYRVWKFIVGGNQNPIPDYMVDKLNHVFALDSIMIDGKPLSPTEDASFEKNTEIDFPMSAISIELAERNNDEVYATITGGLEIIDIIPAYPFVITKMGIGYAGSAVFEYNTATRIGNLTDLNNWIAARNADLLTEQFEGTIAIEGTTGVVYNLGDAETYDYAFSTVLADPVLITTTTPGVATINMNLVLSPQVAGSAEIVLTLPTGAIADHSNITAFNSAISESYVSPGSGTYVWELFHDKQLLKLEFDCTRLSNVAIQGAYPPFVNLEYFGIKNSVVLLVFDIWEKLKGLRHCLKDVSITNCSLFFDPGNFWVLETPLLNGWLYLKGIALNNNALTVAKVDAFCNSMQSASVAGEFYATNGYTITKFQTPTAAPTATSAAARSLITSNYNWFFLTD